ncbi:MAG: class I SAM-dependent DNA methyltransferase [Candidatus Thorarchaeota archaeon]
MNPERTPELFDAWADTYDDIIKSWSSGFPFLGYEALLDRIHEIASPNPEMTVLDVGIGTGSLASRFAESGCVIWGLDYSSRMLEHAARRIPMATLVNLDLRSDWSSRIATRFDRIVSAYVLHHFDLQTNLKLIPRMVNYLTPDGFILIGDVSFTTLEDHDTARKNLQGLWDEDEHYFVANELCEGLRRMNLEISYEQVSLYGGIYHITRGSKNEY